MKKEYAKVELKAKNAPTGSYAAGCPQYTPGRDYNSYPAGHPGNGCKACECSK